MTTTPTVDFDTIKTRQQATWGSGNYSVIGTTLQIIGETLCEAVDVEARDHVLDVAAGNGNAALAAARRGATVTASDYVPTLLEALRARGAADGLEIEARTADAEALPFDDASFDVVLSTLGVMFTPNQERAAAELIRVTRPGGRIGLANWTPDSFIGQVFRIVGRYVAPPAGIRSPLEWGTESRVAVLLGDDVESIVATRRTFVFRYRSAEQWLDTFRSFYGPMVRAFGALDDAAQQSFAQELLELARSFDTSTSGSVRIPSDYLEVVAERSA